MQRALAIAGLLLVTLTACNGEVTLHAGMPLVEAQDMVDAAGLETFAMTALRRELDGTLVSSPIIMFMLDDSTGFRLRESESTPGALGEIKVVHGLGGFKGDYVFESRTELRVR